jgi:hypothetical protein
MSDLIKDLEQLKKDINNKLERYELLKQEYKATGVIPEGMITCPQCGELLFIEADFCPECKCTLNNRDNSSTNVISLANYNNNPNSNPNIVINNMPSSSSSSSASSSASNSNVIVRPKRKRSKLFDFFMFNATGGLWTIWMLIRPKDK